MRAWAIGAAAMATVLAGCASTGGGQSVVPQSAVADVGEGLEIGALSPQSLEMGDCGLFLFSLSASQLVFFSTTRTREARMVFNDREVRLPRVASAGTPIIGGQMARQRFRNNPVNVDLTLRRGDEIEGGVRIAESVLRVTHSNGWNVVLPVAGLAYCRTPETDPSARSAMGRRR